MNKVEKLNLYTDVYYYPLTTAKKRNKNGERVWIFRRFNRGIYLPEPGNPGVWL